MANLIASATALIDGAYALITSPGRDIGGIIPDITIEETGTDATQITDHPVETGAAISDHAFNLPCELVMRCGWSDSSGGYEGYSAEVYAMLLRLRATRQPFTVSTGKRQYKNMLIKLIAQTTDDPLEHALVCTVAMREVILVSTQRTAAANSNNPGQAADPAPAGATSLAATATAPTFGAMTGLRGAAPAQRLANGEAAL